MPQEEDTPPITPVLIDSNLFIALDAKFGQLEAQNYAQEIIKEARKSGFDPKILRCVLDEVKKHYMRSAIMKVCDPVSIADEDGLKVASMTTCKLTKGDNLRLQADSRRHGFGAEKAPSRVERLPPEA